MKKHLKHLSKLLLIFIMLLGSSFFIWNIHAADNNYTDVYRMYNPNSGEHLYADTNEANTLFKNSWGDNEGAKWESPTAPLTDDGNSYPVYRMYNHTSGEHIFTKDENEKNTLPAIDPSWTSEGIAWYSDPTGTLSIYRLFNPQSGEHLFSADQNEVNTLVSTGWSNEGAVCTAKEDTSPALQPGRIPRPEPQPVITAAPAPSTPTAGGTYVGSIKSDVYHYPSCRSAKRIKSYNLVTFSSVQQAQQAGYRPCDVCHPQ